MAVEPGDIEGRIAALVRPVVDDFGFELVEIVFRRENHGWILRLVIFSPTGVTLDDCARVSREAGYLLEVEDLVPGRYRLEVSSPGLDRPLRNAADFRRYPGHAVRLVLIDAPEPVVGRIGEVDEQRVVIELDDRSMEVPYALIVKAHLVIEF